MTISVDPLEPEEDGEPAHAAPLPDFPAGSFLVLDQVFQDAVELYECHHIDTCRP